MSINRFVHKMVVPQPPQGKSVIFENFLLICTVFPRGVVKPNFADKNLHGEPGQKSQPRQAVKATVVISAVPLCNPLATSMANPGTAKGTVKRAYREAVVQTREEGQWPLSRQGGQTPLEP